MDAHARLIKQAPAVAQLGEQCGVSTRRRFKSVLQDLFFCYHRGIHFEHASFGFFCLSSMIIQHVAGQLLDTVFLQISQKKMKLLLTRSTALI